MKLVSFARNICDLEKPLHCFYKIYAFDLNMKLLTHFKMTCGLVYACESQKGNLKNSIIIHGIFNVINQEESRRCDTLKHV